MAEHLRMVQPWQAVLLAEAEVKQNKKLLERVPEEQEAVQVGARGPSALCVQPTMDGQALQGEGEGRFEEVGGGRAEAAGMRAVGGGGGAAPALRRPHHQTANSTQEQSDSQYYWQ